MVVLLSPVSSTSSHAGVVSTSKKIRNEMYRRRRRKTGYLCGRRPVILKVVGMGKERSESRGLAVKLAIAGGLISNPVIGWSLYTLKNTGCGLPPGPGGSIGALEGVSYLVVIGIIGWSLFTKTKTGSGLPNGPFGLLGAVEGLSYLSFLAILLVFGLQFYEQGSIPGDQCFG